MKIVAVSGGSGTGKTTVAEHLVKKLPNAVRIDVDKIMLEVSAEMEDQILKIMGIKYYKGFFAFNEYFKSYNNILIWMYVIRDEVIRRLVNEIAKCKEENDYVVVDWVLFPYCDFYSKCEETIWVKSDQEKAEERIKHKLKYKDIYIEHKDKPKIFFEPKSIKNRAKYTCFNKANKISKYVIVNDGNMTELIENVDNIAREIDSSLDIVSQKNEEYER